jgi:hypothetical protein
MSAAKSGDGVSEVISQPAPASCIQVPMFEATEAIQRARKSGRRKGLQADSFAISGCCFVATLVSACCNAILPFTHCSSFFSPPRLPCYASEQDSAIISTAPSEVPGTERPLARRTNPRECFQPTQSLHRLVPLLPRLREDWPLARRTLSFALSSDQRSGTLARTRSRRFARCRGSPNHTKGDLLAQKKTNRHSPLRVP